MWAALWFIIQKQTFTKACYAALSVILSASEISTHTWNIFQKGPTAGIQ